MLKITTGPLEKVLRQSRNESEYVTHWEKLFHAALSMNLDIVTESLNETI